MRLLLSKNSRKELFDYLKRKNNCETFNELSKKLSIPRGTLQKWLLGKYYLPDKIIPKEIREKINIEDKKDDNWGRIKGGKKTYKILVEKYGIREIRKRQSNGGIKTKDNLIKEEKPFIIDLGNPLFLEFYGILLGDGWLSHLKYKNKDIWLIGVSGDKRLDKDFFIYLKNNIKMLFERDASIKERKNNNGAELDFCHKMLIKALNRDLNFPIGYKLDLEIHNSIYNAGFEKMKHVIRGIFDTDGSFYFDKTPSGNPYPCIDITMKAPKLIKQVHETLIKQGFKARHDKHRHPIEQIVLKGRKQLKKWMSEIGSNNRRHLNKIALVAQPG